MQWKDKDGNNCYGINPETNEPETENETIEEVEEIELPKTVKSSGRTRSGSKPKQNS